MEATPKLLILKRQTLAHMGAAKVALDTLAGVSVTTGGVSALSSQMAGTRIDLLLPIIAAILGTISLLSRTVLAYYINTAVIANPINVSAMQTITQPEPLTDADPKSLPEP